MLPAVAGEFSSPRSDLEGSSTPCNAPRRKQLYATLLGAISPPYHNPGGIASSLRNTSTEVQLRAVPGSFSSPCNTRAPPRQILRTAPRPSVIMQCFPSPEQSLWRDRATLPRPHPNHDPANWSGPSHSLPPPSPPLPQELPYSRRCPQCPSVEPQAWVMLHGPSALRCETH